jgi:5-methylcytosine-specific restriction protein A
MIEKLCSAALLLPEEIREPGLFVEGASHQVTVNAYERNPAARAACIAHYGSTCVVCGFNFGAVYGPLGKGFIHVHHLKPLAEISGRYEVDPITDLRPVCPNCHAIIHLGGGCRDIDEARRLVDPRVLSFWASFTEQIAATAHRPRD